MKKTRTTTKTTETTVSTDSAGSTRFNSDVNEQENTTVEIREEHLVVNDSL